MDAHSLAQNGRKLSGDAQTLASVVAVLAHRLFAGGFELLGDVRAVFAEAVRAIAGDGGCVSGQAVVAVMVSLQRGGGGLDALDNGSRIASLHWSHIISSVI